VLNDQTRLTAMSCLGVRMRGGDEVEKTTTQFSGKLTRRWHIIILMLYYLQ